MDPFVVGVSSIGLLAKMKEFKDKNQCAMLHIDATYKIKKESYPLVVLGISDVARRFHLLLLQMKSPTIYYNILYCKPNY
jgi:hypothetical protein